MFQRVTIIGMGLIGGSIGLALQKKHAASDIIGYDPGKGVCERARKMGVITQSYETLAKAVCGAELVLLATPVGAMHQLLQDIAPVLTPGTVVTDVASTKAQVIDWARELLPAHVSFVGGHPMAGREVSGVEAADAGLFSNRLYCLTPTATTSQEAIKKVCALVELLGARVRFLDAVTHDDLVASVSHLPYLASVALMNTLTEDDTWSEALSLAASGFRDTTRLAAGNPVMHRDICLTNSSSIVSWLDKYIASLQMLREHVAAHDQQIDKIFSQAQQERLQWQNIQSLADSE